MDADMQFGELEQKPTATRFRPDCNGQLAVARVYAPRPDELPIFVDLDVMREILDHAHSDRRVELGGVLLGGQYEDEHGQPFVLVTDCLRARDYESTKGSFKFTHDTWEKITREREQLPPDLHMVGWYHTHPDWGVFLSGLDMFICDHFFNKPLDVALVVDPCQSDTGFFQWTGQAGARIRRTGGYFLFASRFRNDELHRFAAELEAPPMTDLARTPPASIVVQAPPSPPPPTWQSLAVLAMLTLQFTLLLLVAIRWLPPGSPTGTPSVASQDLADLKQSIERLEAVRQREADVDAKLQVLEMVVRQGGEAPEGILQSLAERTSEAEQLRNSLRGQQSLTKELDSKLNELESKAREAQSGEERSRAQVAKLQEQIDSLGAELKTARRKLAESPVAGAATPPADKAGWKSWLADGKSLGLGALLGAAVVGITLFAVMRRQHALQLEAEPKEHEPISEPS